MIRNVRSLILGDGIKARVIRGGGLSFLNLGVHNVMRLGSNLILTRLLFPEAFGLMAIVVVVNTTAVYLFGLYAVNGLAELLDDLPDRHLDAPSARDRVNSILRDHPRALVFALVYAGLLGACSLTIAPAVRVTSS